MKEPPTGIARPGDRRLRCSPPGPGRRDARRSRSQEHAAFVLRSHPWRYAVQSDEGHEGDHRRPHNVVRTHRSRGKFAICEASAGGKRLASASIATLKLKLAPKNCAIHCNIYPHYTSATRMWYPQTPAERGRLCLIKLFAA